MSAQDIVDELTYRLYAWNREQYGLKPESCFQMWGEVLVDAMEQRYRSEKSHAA